MELLAVQLLLYCLTLLVVLGYHKVIAFS